MPDFYVYLISSLPMLHFQAKPPLSFAQFIEICKDKISASEIQLIESLGRGRVFDFLHPALKKWCAFDIALRNELVKIRASRKHIDPLKYLRGDGYTGADIAHIAMSAYRMPSILESEKFLDEERWRRLDELAVGHYFDLDFLIVYALKLLILERWERIGSADKPALLKEVLN